MTIFYSNSTKINSIFEWKSPRVENNVLLTVFLQMFAGYLFCLSSVDKISLLHICILCQLFMCLCSCGESFLGHCVLRAVAERHPVPELLACKGVINAVS